MFTTIINDCRDDNARGRQTSRLSSLLTTNVSFVGVQSDLEAGVQLIDMLDATEGRRGLILVNVAPRGGHTTKWENGTPFAYFYYHDTLIITSIDGHTLSGVKKFGLVDEISLLDTYSAAAAMLKEGFIAPDAAARIPTSQFRSFDFTPRIGAFLMSGGEVPTEPYPLENVLDLPAAVWHIDNFGNCKTTLSASDLGEATKITTRFGTVPYYSQLRAVPDGEAGLVGSSSGLDDTRFLELVQQRKNFATTHGVKLGDDIFTPTSHFRQATT